ncbi:uncharacterized protein LOC102678060 isoform X2 [Apis dorsata]|uniref:uncharacterized protein LOC102678060 isoform X2 n=1 Tax=Apis dorsata TaxID=7462 RepID=UPI0012932A46|nr:uncharacterized protein LOC102678060 isoform X2 [Apis dorsata]
MFEELDNFFKFDYNSRKLHNKNTKNIYSNTVLDVISEKQYNKEINISKEKKNIEELDNVKTINYPDINTKQYISILNKTSRKVPNILKNKSKSERIFEADATKSNSFKDVTNKDEHESLFNPDLISEYNSSENILTKKEKKHKRVSRRRKQELNFTNICHELPKWSICSFVDDKKKMIGKKLGKPKTLESLTQGKKLKHHSKKQNKKQQISILKNKGKEKYLPSISQDILTDYNSECQNLSFSKEIESNDLEDLIDFSSNEIFNKFNYEFYNNNSDCYTCYSMNYETCNPLNAIHESDSYENIFDINDNEVDIYNTTLYSSLTDNEHDEKNISIRKFMMSPDYKNEDLSFSDNKSKCSSDSFCNYCFEDCVSNWIETSAASIHSEAFNDIKQNNLDSSSFHNPKYNEYLNDDREYSSRRSSLTESECSLEITDDIDSLLTEFERYSDEKKNSETEIFKQTIYTQKQKEYDGSMENLHDTNILQIQDDNGTNISKDKYKCLSCSLKFSNTRTLAMHQAGAHGVFLFRHKSSLIHHLKIVHHIHYARNRTATFVCNVCNKIYSKFGAFENHMKSHKNEPDCMDTPNDVTS